MLRIVHLVILPGILLTTCAGWVCADPVAKQKYSNRPIGFTVPNPYYGTPTSPRFAVSPVVHCQPALTQARQIVIETDPVPGNSAPVSVQPLASPQIIENRIFIEREKPAEVSVNDELDVFYARMAKMCVEKHQLPNALALIENIKSDISKIRTLVDLAEYVSRDKNYEAEAKVLYSLALEGTVALNKQQPFRINTGGAKIEIPTFVVPPVPPTQPLVPVRPTVETRVPEPPPTPPFVVPSIDPAQATPPPRVPEEIPDDPPPAPPAVSPSQISNTIIPPKPPDPLSVQNELKQNEDGVKNGKIPPPNPPREKNVDGETFVGSPREVKAPPADIPPVTPLIPPFMISPPSNSLNDATIIDGNGNPFKRPGAMINLDPEGEGQKEIPKHDSTTIFPSPRTPRKGVPIVLPGEPMDEN